MEPGHQGSEGGAQTHERGAVVVHFSYGAVAELLRRHHEGLITTGEFVEELVDAMEFRREGGHAPTAA